MIRPGKASNVVFGIMVALLLIMVLTPIAVGIGAFGTMAVVRALGLHELWVVVVAFLVSPAIAIVASILIAMRVVRASSPNRPRALDICAACGYSLEGLTGDRCPECGAWLDEAQRARRKES